MKILIKLFNEKLMKSTTPLKIQIIKNNNHYNSSPILFQFLIVIYMHYVYVKKM